MKGAVAVAALSLREQLLGLAGVAEAEVDGSDEAPSGVRIHLAPEADAVAVGAGVQRVLAAHGVRSRLGSSRSSLPAASPRGAPEVQVSMPPRTADRRLQSVMVEESGAALQVTVVASDGSRATRGAARVGEPELVEAVIAAVGLLLEQSEASVLNVEWMTVGESRVVTVVLEGTGGRRGAGAGLVRASLGYAVARAAWSALSE